MTVLKVSSRLVLLKELLERSLELSEVSFQKFLKCQVISPSTFGPPLLETKN